MSPTPQMTKLTMMSPMTTVMIALPTTPWAALRIDFEHWDVFAFA